MGVRIRERQLQFVGLLFVGAVFLSFIIFANYLPSGEEPYSLSRLRHRGVDRDRQLLKEKIEKANIPPPPLPKPQLVEDISDVVQKRDFIKEMMRFAWTGYRQYAWGSNELKPISKTGHSQSVFGGGDMGASIVDAIDTLWLMGLKDEYDEARKWIEFSFDLSRSTKGDLSVFETNIRFVGGLLSIHALTNDSMFVRKAEEVAKLLLPAFNTPTGIPYAMVNPRTGSAHNWGWASGGSSILAEFGTLQLGPSSTQLLFHHSEFDYLSHETGNPLYASKITRIRDVLTGLDKPEGLYPLYLNPKTLKWGQRHYSIGAMGDSFYEYLLKHWLITGKKDDRTKREYDEAVFAMEKKQLFQSEPGKLWYFADLKGSRVEHKMDHLACFAAGMFALQSENEENSTSKEHYLDLAEKIAHTCHESYIRSDTGIGPERFRFTNDAEAVAISEGDKYYILRPEVVEGWFYLWRITGKQKYRDWVWDAAQAIEKYCRVQAGYSGIRNVYTTNVEHDDVQQSFLLAETLKYLYLTFDDSLLPLSHWVFNTEAHPFPVRS